MAHALIASVAQSTGGVALSDNGSHVNRIQIPNSTGKKSYIVAQNNRGGSDQGRWECSCPGWCGHRKCKHLTAMLPSLSQLGKPGNLALAAF